MCGRSTMKETFQDPNVKAALPPYHYNARRNRLPVHFKGEAEPYKRFCQARLPPLHLSLLVAGAGFVMDGLV